MEVKTGPEEPLVSWCSACWRDRIITTNGKCRVCGTDLVKRHWKTSIKKLELVLQSNGAIPLEIKGMMYLIPKAKMVEFMHIESYTDKIKFIEEVKKSCKSYKI